MTCRHYILLLDNIDIILFENGTDAEANSTKPTVERWEEVNRN
jgi:hypothetical protein